MKKIALLLLTCLLLTLSGQAQELRIESFVENEKDSSAINSRRSDLNGEPCALLKVVTNDDIDRVEGNIVGQVADHDGVQWIYLTNGSRMVRIIPSQHLPLMVNFADYNITSLKGQKTYVLTLSGGTKKQKEVTVLEQDSEEPYSGSNIETFSVGGVSFNMIRVSGGKFLMGATPEQENLAEEDEYPVHEVKLSTYWIGETEVTQALWEAVMGNNPVKEMNRKSRNGTYTVWGSDYPVVMVDRNYILKFISRLSELTGRQFRLPTEAEWEFAARGGRKSRGTMFSGSDTPKEVAWAGSYERKPSRYERYGMHPVKTKLPNELGIYDMSGNVSEKCSDWYGSYSKEPQTNPKGPNSGEFYVQRGGDDLLEVNCRISAREKDCTACVATGEGFRLALSAQ